MNTFIYVILGIIVFVFFYYLSKHYLTKKINTGKTLHDSTQKDETIEKEVKEKKLGSLTEIRARIKELLVSNEKEAVILVIFKEYSFSSRAEASRMVEDEILRQKRNKERDLQIDRNRVIKNKLLKNNKTTTVAFVMSEYNMPKGIATSVVNDVITLNKLKWNLGRRCYEYGSKNI